MKIAPTDMERIDFKIYWEGGANIFPGFTVIVRLFSLSSALTPAEGCLRPIATLMGGSTEAMRLINAVFEHVMAAHVVFKAQRFLHSEFLVDEVLGSRSVLVLVYNSV